LLETHTGSHQSFNPRAYARRDKPVFFNLTI
jgi:hypothetical protein